MEQQQIEQELLQFKGAAYDVSKEITRLTDILHKYNTTIVQLEQQLIEIKQQDKLDSATRAKKTK